MNLQEQLYRIKSMMGTINEDTSNIKGLVQELVNNSIDDLRYICDTMNSDHDEIVSFGACDLIDSSINVTVTNIKKEEQLVIITLLIKYKNYSFIDEDSFVYELNDMLNKFGRFNIVVEDSINTFEHR